MDDNEAVLAASVLECRLFTTCIACPPDPLPEGDFCSWRFTLENA